MNCDLSPDICISSIYAFPSSPEMNNRQEVEVSTTVDNSTLWLTWCRLCAKSEESNHLIFPKSDTGQSSLLATSIGKFFWVNVSKVTPYCFFNSLNNECFQIKADDQISTSICKECHRLIDQLSSFTERVNKVQTLFCLLQNLKPTTETDANSIRLQIGLTEDWEHIIKDEPTDTKSLKPKFANQEVQTDLVIFFNTGCSSNTREISVDKTRKNQSSGKEEPSQHKKNEVTETKRKPSQQNRDLSETGTDDEVVVEVDTEQEVVQNFEYLIQNNDDLIEVDEDHFRYKIIKHKRSSGSQEHGQDVEDSDLFKELKFKSDEIEDDELKSVYHLSQDNNTKYSNLPLEEDENVSEELEEDYVDMEDEQYYEEEYDDLTDPSAKGEEEPSSTQNSPKSSTVQKRGRPFKKTDRKSSAYRYECEDCRRKYKNPNVYRKHMRSCHNVVIESMPDFECPICKKDCSTRGRLKLHMRQHLPEEEKLVVPCPFCDRKFGQIGAMRQHVKGIHQELKPYICDQCGRACKTLAALKEHQFVHTDECPFECNVCKKRFKNKPRLKAHMDTHNESAYKCEDCGLILNTRRTLLQHQLVHSNVKRFKCEFCDAAFKRAKSLKNHLILHSGLKPYKCQFCDKSFSNGSNCRSHKRRVHPKELAEEEARGKKNEPVPIPKLEDLKAA